MDEVKKRFSGADIDTAIRCLGKRRTGEMLGLVWTLQCRLASEPRVVRLSPELMVSRQLYESRTVPQLDILLRLRVYESGVGYHTGSVTVHCEQRLGETPKECKDRFMELVRHASAEATPEATQQATI